MDEHPKSTLSKPITTRLNLSKPDVQETILEAVKAFGTPEEVEYVAKILKTIDGIVEVELKDLAVDNFNKCLLSFRDITAKIDIKKLIGKLINKGIPTNKISTDYLNGLVRDSEYRVDLEDEYKLLISTRNSSIAELKQIAIESQKDRKNTNIAKFGGAFVSLSAVLAGASVLLTGGTSIPFLYGAASIGGATTSGGAELLRYNLSKGEINNAKKIIDQDKQAVDTFLDRLDQYKKQTIDRLESVYEIDELVLSFQEIQKESIEVTLRIGNIMQEKIGYVKSIRKVVDIKDGKKMDKLVLLTGGGEIITRVFGTVKAVSSFADDAVKSVADKAVKSVADNAVKSVANKAVKSVADNAVKSVADNAVKSVADNAVKSLAEDTTKYLSFGTKLSLAVCAVGAALDTCTVVTTARDLNDGSPDEAAEMIKKAARDLENIKIPELNHFIIETKVQAAREKGLYIEGLPE